MSRTRTPSGHLSHRSILAYPDTWTLLATPANGATLHAEEWRCTEQTASRPSQAQQSSMPAAQGPKNVGHQLASQQACAACSPGMRSACAGWLSIFRTKVLSGILTCSSLSATPNFVMSPHS